MSFIVLGVGNGRRQMLIKEKLDYTVEHYSVVVYRVECFPRVIWGRDLEAK